ncbi:hypothetical protein ACQJBY_061862 [Aegilops geniculata]
MMEVAVESPQPAAWDHFKEKVELMEEENGGASAAAAAAAAAAAGELLTREIKKRLLVHAHENGNGHDHASGGGAEELEAAPEVEQKEEEEEEAPEEPKVAEEEQQRHMTIFFDAAKVPDIITEVSATYLVTGTMRSGAEKEDAKGNLSPKGKELEAHENGKLENGSHSNGSHQVPSASEPKTEYLFEINKNEIYPTEIDKDKPVTEAQPKVEEYDLEKILDQQETHDLFCPNCKSCITRRVILKKRKRTVRTTPTDGPSKRPYTEEVLVPLPSSTLPGGDEQESPDVFRCLSCFSFFIPAGCSFNIFRIFGRRDVDQVDVLPPPESADTPPRSENCTSWLLSCFQPEDSPNQPHPADSVTVPLLSGAQSSNNTTTTTESSTSYVHHSHGTVVKPEQPTVGPSSENQAAPDPTTTPLLSDTQSPNDTTTTTESSTSYVHHSHGTVVKPEHSITESSSEDQTTTTTTTTTTSATATTSSTTTSAAATTHSSSAAGIFHSDVMEVITGEMPPPKPAGGVTMDATHHLLGHEDVHGTATTTFENDSFTTHASHTSTLKVDGPNATTIARGDLPPSPNPQPADHVVVPVFGGVNQVAPRPQQRDDWDIPKAIVYGGLVESVTSLSVVSAAASSGAKTLDIFILGIANLVGGLPLIYHNIAVLRDIRDVNDDNEQVGQYWLQLGRRSKARVHMVLALLSYIVFGLLPPVVYGLSFRESNDRENKMMAVAGASLASIALLALGKAHVQIAPRTYFKTLMYYLTIAVSSSGMSYVAGVLITRLLVQFGIVEQGGSAAPAPPGLSFPHSEGAQTSAWASF